MKTGSIRFRGLVIYLFKTMLLLGLVGVFILVWLFGYPQSIFKNTGNYFLVFTYCGALILFLMLYGGFKVGTLSLGELIYSYCLSLVCTNVVMLIELCLVARWLVPIMPMFLGTVFQVFIIGLGCWMTHTLYFRLYPATKLVVVHSGEEDDLRLLAKMQTIKERYDIAENIKDTMPIDRITNLIGRHGRALICDIDPSIKQQIQAYCYRHHLTLYVVPTIEEVALHSAYSTQLFDTPVLLCRNKGLTEQQKVVKRMIDIVGSLTMILITSPIMLLTALAIWLEDRGPIVYTQTRLTLDDERFNILKFRSMITKAEEDGVARLCQKGDTRITKVGKLIRACRIDELPQLFNVLGGHMSLVGPRPERPEMIQEYEMQSPEIAHRTKVKAGLTGLAQVKGKYNTTPKDKLLFDLMYIENYSLWMDIKIVMMTFKVLFMLESTEGVEEVEPYKSMTSKTVKIESEKIKAIG